MTRSQRAAMTAIRHLSDAISGLSEAQSWTSAVRWCGVKKAERSIASAMEKIEIYKKGISDDQD